MIIIMAVTTTYMGNDDDVNIHQGICDKMSNNDELMKAEYHCAAMPPTLTLFPKLQKMDKAGQWHSRPAA